MVERRVGNTKLYLPALGLGTAHLGELYGLVDEDDARATLEAAWEVGVRYYDTAPWYGRGLAEHRLGSFLRSKPRDAFQITTKVGRSLHRPANPHDFDRSPWTGGLNFSVRFDYSYDGIMRSYEQVLQRLSLDTVDALVIHDLDSGYHGDGVADHMRDLVASGLKALGELKATGDIKACGMGINTAEALDTIAPQVDIDFALISMPYTLLDQSSLHTGMARCLERGVSVIIGAPFASGVLATGCGDDAKYGYEAAPPVVQEKVRRIEAICRAYDVSLPSVALQFPLAHPAVVSVIPGASHRSEVVENFASAHANIPDALWSELKSEKLIAADAPVTVRSRFQKYG